MTAVGRLVARLTPETVRRCSTEMPSREFSECRLMREPSRREGRVNTGILLLSFFFSR